MNKRLTASVAPDVAADVWRHLRNRDQRPRPALPENRGKLRVENLTADTTAEVYIYEEIGYWGVTAQDFVDVLRNVNASSIDLHINSPGGDVFDGVAIYNALADHPATVNVYVDGLAASAASFIAMAGDTVVMNRASQLMIHDASGFCIGNAADMAIMQGLLDRVSDTIAGIYSAKAGSDVAFWRDLMRAETWYSSAEAVTAGLADSAADAPEADPDEEKQDEPAARHDLALTSFLYAGRAQSPAPPAPPTQTTSKLQFDPAAFRQAVKEGVRT